MGTTWLDLLRPGDASDFFDRRTNTAFESGATGYSPVNAIWLAELCRLVYRHDTEEDTPAPIPRRVTYLETAGFKQLAFFNSGPSGMQAMLVEHQLDPKFAVLAFRGTEQKLQDFIADLEINVIPLNQNDIEVHPGFSSGLASIWGLVETELNKLSCPIFYTGHSLGAALATLAALKKAPSAVYTYGSPRVGNIAFVNALKNIPIYRVVDNIDVVETVPLETMGYCHAGKEHWLRGRNFDISVAQLFEPAEPLADHALINYVDRI